MAVLDAVEIGRYVFLVDILESGGEERMIREWSSGQLQKQGRIMRT